MPALRLLYVMDPMSRVLVDKDTTFAFQLEGQKRGHEQYHCEPQALFVERTVPHATVRRVEVERAAVPFHLFEARTVPLGAFDVVFMRKDPPFDMAFFFATHLLGLVDAAATLVVNAPRGLSIFANRIAAASAGTAVASPLVASNPTAIIWPAS